MGVLALVLMMKDGLDAYHCCDGALIGCCEEDIINRGTGSVKTRPSLSHGLPWEDGDNG